MLNVKPFGNISELSKPISSSDKVITLPMGDVVRFKVPSSDHFYITVRNGSSREFMKVTSVIGDKLHVERGVDDTTALSFPKGSCVKVEWNPSQLCEFVKGCVNVESKKGIEPQTICWSCDTCIEIDEGGHIVNVNGSNKC
jgi:hypothetical protein|nr:MAG TPA: hypothetical protein [Caudoviricetes sp.]